LRDTRGQQTIAKVLILGRRRVVKKTTPITMKITQGAEKHSTLHPHVPELGVFGVLGLIAHRLFEAGTVALDEDDEVLNGAYHIRVSRRLRSDLKHGDGEDGNGDRCGRWDGGRGCELSAGESL
jgi:hypothetical protein